MLLGSLTVLIMLIVAYCHWREGLLTAACMAVNVFLAGLVAFNFWEPLADQLEPLLAGTFLLGYEDALCLVGLFAVALVLLRTAVNRLARSEPEYPAKSRQVGGAVCGLITGYLAAGFLLCVLQTLPLPVNFFGFYYEVSQNAGGAKTPRVLPPDHAWLALMHGGGFDPNGTFEIRYARHRRIADDREPPTLPARNEEEPLEK
jgi:hypothetical protein